MGCTDLSDAILCGAPADASADVPAVLRGAGTSAVRAIHGCSSSAAGDSGGHNYDRAPPVLENEKEQEKDDQEEEERHLPLKDRNSPDQMRVFLPASEPTDPRPIMLLLYLE